MRKKGSPEGKKIMLNFVVSTILFVPSVLLDW
jgi:hypothetical protein